MIRNVIFDLGNVLISFRPKELLSRVIKNADRISEFISKVTSSKTWLKLDQGTISLLHARDIFLKKYPEEEMLLTYFFNNWRDLFAPIPKNIEILKKLKNSGYKTFVLSNFVKEPFEYVTSKFDFFQFFDGMVISCKENAIKPEKEIYEILLRKFELIPDECLFIDDVQSFCLGAEKLGINTIQLKSGMDLSSELQKINIII